MTDNEIIKALECCNSHGIDACIECPYCDKYPNCIGDRNDDCINLIKRQKAEIERLKQTPKCVYAYDGKTVEYCVEGPCSVEKTIDEIKSEAIREFAERLKEMASQTFWESDAYVGTEQIDSLAKEMKEEKE